MLPIVFVHAAALEIIPASRDHFVPCVGNHVLPVRESLPGAGMQVHSQLRHRHKGQGLHRVQVQTLHSSHLLIQGTVHAQADPQVRYRHRDQGLHRLQVQTLHSAHLLIQGKSTCKG